MYYIIDSETGNRCPCAVAPRATIRNLREVFSMLDKGAEPCVAQGLTRARRAVTRRISLMEFPLTDDELLLLDGWSPTPTALWRLKARGRID